MKNSDLIFEKSITRDWSIVYTQIWHESYTKEFKKQFGWGYQEVIYEGCEGMTTGYRATIEHVVGLCNFVIKKLEKDPAWLAKESKKLIAQIRTALDYIKKHKEKNLKSYDNKKLAKVFEKFVALNIDLGPRFIINLWFPTNMEHNEKFGKYKKAIDSAVKARKISEKIGPAADEFVRIVEDEVAARMGLSKNLAKYLTYQEILSYLYEAIIPNTRELQKRSKYFLVAAEGVVVGEKMEHYMHRLGFGLKKISVNKFSKIQGSSAFPGKIQGKVRIVVNKSTFLKFNKSEILVASMTTPDFLPMLKRASAFITDEGGITCHAAIVARELKKPCIIGTKIATKVLRDGDFVEVDADKGTVKILKKS